LDTLKRSFCALLILTTLGYATRANAGPDNNVLGSQVETVINGAPLANLVFEYPEISFGNAACPKHVNLAGSTIGKCMIPVGGTTIPVEVISDPQGRFGFGIRISQIIVERARAESAFQSEIEAGSGLSGPARCPGAAVRIVAVMKTVSCTIRLRGRDIKGLLTAYQRERLDVSSPAELLQRLFLQPQYVRAGVIPKAVAEPIIRTHMLARDVRLRGMIGLVSCPGRVLDLRNGRHVSCSVSINGQPLSVIVSLPDTLDVETTKVIVFRDRVVDGLRSLLVRTYGMEPFTIDCGANGIALMEPGSSFACNITRPGQAMQQVSMTIDNPSGVPRLDDLSAFGIWSAPGEELDGAQSPHQ
jgi:hypothetical protein